MRTLLFAFVTTVLTFATTDGAEITDPVADFLLRTDKAIYRPSLPGFYLDDQVYRFDVDLNQDGRNEVLVSSSLDRDGKQGNVFYVYRTVSNGFENAGQIHLSPNGFYLGRIEEVNSYGIVTFLPSGGGTGAYMAYLFNGVTIGETPLGAIERNPTTGEVEGDGIKLAAEYSGSPPEAIRHQVEQFRANNGITPPESSAFITQPQKISAAELAQKYNIKVTETTVEQALRASLSPIPAPAAQARTGSTVTPAVESPTRKGPERPSPAATVNGTKSARVPLILIFVIVAAVAGTIVFLFWRRSR